MLPELTFMPPPDIVIPSAVIQQIPPVPVMMPLFVLNEPRTVMVRSWDPFMMVAPPEIEKLPPL